MPQLDNYTNEEKQAIEQLKQRITHDLTPRLLEDETLFHRFLKARDFNVENAEIMLRKHLSDRKLYGFDDVIDNYVPPKYIEAYFPTSFVGFDKEGFVVRYADMGGADLKGLTELFTFKQGVHYAINCVERDFDYTRKQTKKLGREISKLVAIVNVDKMDLFQVTSRKVLEWIFKGMPLYQDNYPERIKAIYVINASAYYYVLFSIIKSVLAAAFIEKIKVFGKSGWQEFLLNEIDADVLPAFLGGNRTDLDGNPLCNSFIVHGKKIPPELYKRKNKSSMRTENDVKKLTVNRLSKCEIDIYVSEPNICIEWEFEVKNKDIDFSFYYKDNSIENSNIEELISKQRINTMISSETGLYKCTKIGMYTVKFDNTYSWIHSKEIYYRILLKSENLI